MKKEDLLGKELAQKVELLAIAPVEGRYATISERLNEYFSEYALMKHRVFVEINWLDFFITTVNDVPLLKDVNISDYDLARIWGIYYDFDINAAVKVKEIEKIRKHDVKSIEYYIDDELKKVGLEKLIPLVHIGLTSEDINNTSYALIIKEALNNVWIPAAEDFIDDLSYVAYYEYDVAMLGHTHGQHATPVTVGKEFAVYVYRLKKVLEKIKNAKIYGKFNGATGCYSALTTAFPDEDWILLCKSFICEYLELEFNPVTTQIESHDYAADLFDLIRHFNNIILDFDLDLWMYISKNYFKQVTVKDEVGSSVMPHKVNPISFENSEGSSYISNALLMAFSNKLTTSRWQRDLSDSTVQRYIGEAIGISLLVIENSKRGLQRCEVNVDQIDDELSESWEVLAEPIQTMLRKYGIPDAYEQLKELTRGKEITDEDIYNFVSSLDTISDKDKETLINLTPSTYIGRTESIISNI